MKKILAIVLCFVIFACSLVSCNGNTQNTESTTTTTTTTTTQKPPIDYPIEVDYSYEIVEGKKEPVQMTSQTITTLHVKTNKDPYDYLVGEDVIFTVVNRTTTQDAACEYFHVTLRYDGLGTTEDFYIDGSTGQFTLTTQIAEPGYVMMYVWACNGNKQPYANAEMACVGAGAQITEIEHTGDEPEDFDAYWKEKTDALLEISPDVLKFELYQSTNSYDIYNVRILAVDDSEFYQNSNIEKNKPHNYVSGLLAIPKGAAEKSCALKATFHGHGVGKAEVPSYVLDGKTIVFDIIAHSIDAVEENYDSLRWGVIGNYGINYQTETDPNNVYYNNMLLRNLQALRFLVSYFGEGGEGGNLWNGVDFELQGYSQGGFQSCATTALASNVGINITHAKISAPWLCDIGAYADPNTPKIKSNFWPVGDYEVLAYFDATFFAKRITCSAEVSVGLGDETTLPAGVTVLYNSLATEEKQLTLVQNKGHGSVSMAEKSYLVKFSK